MGKPNLEGGERPAPNPDPNAPAEQKRPITGNALIKQMLGHWGSFKLVGVDADQVKADYDGDFTEGGNPAAYWFVPIDEIWIALSTEPGRRIRTALHEVSENLDMSPPEDYDRAHPWANAAEFMFRYFVDALLEGKSEEEAERIAFATTPPVQDPEQQPLLEVPAHPPVVQKEGGGSMPDPRDGESEQDFVDRCVPDVMKEGLDQDAALGKCYGIFRNANKAMGTVDTRAEAEEQMNDAELCKDEEIKPGALPAVLAPDKSGKKIVPGDEGVPEVSDRGDEGREKHSSMSPAARKVAFALRAVVRMAVMRSILHQARKGTLQVDPMELYEGTCEEMEHTADWHQAMQIAVDHLSETPDYYTQLRGAGLMGGGCDHDGLNVKDAAKTEAAGAAGVGDVQADAATTLSSDN